MVEIDKYKLPTPTQIRFLSQAYLLDEFNQAINDINGEFVDPRKRQLRKLFVFIVVFLRNTHFE